MFGEVASGIVLTLSYEPLQINWKWENCDVGEKGVEQMLLW